MPPVARIGVKPSGFREAALRILGQANRLDQELRAAQDEVGHRAVPIFAAHALHGDTGALGAGIRSQWTGDRALVTAHARNPASGYDYVGVTRFGHRGIIVPRADRMPASIVATHRLRARGGNAALRFVIGGRVFYRRSVRGFHPLRDWADTALPEVAGMAQQVMARLGRRITVRGAV